MTPAFEQLQQQLKQLPGVGFRSAERMALHAATIIRRVLGLGAEFLFIDTPGRIGIEDQQIGRCTGCQTAAVEREQPGRIAGQAGKQAQQRRAKHGAPGRKDQQFEPASGFQVSSGAKPLLGLV
mgnify:CR=1 FL=1